MNGKKRFMLIVSVLVLVPCVAVLILFGAALLFAALNPDAFRGPSVSRDNVAGTEYGTAASLYRLTGVKFPELEAVDSLFYDEGGFACYWWTEHKYRLKDGLDRAFEKRLQTACVADPEHWSIEDSGYCYVIYPDMTSAGTSLKVRDRMVKNADGTLSKDWDGSFISVEVQNDAVWVREGWIK